MNRYETNSKGTSPALSSILNQFSKMPRSAFDETRRKTFDASPYAIIPIEVFQMFPNSEAYLKYDIQTITKNPTVRRLMSSMQIELRTYYVKNSDCWEGWNNFITRGRTGKLDLKIPSINFEHTGSDAYGKTTSVPYNPYHFLNICPPYLYDKRQSWFANTGICRKSVVVDGEEQRVKTGLLGTNFDISSSKTYNEGISALPGVFYCKIAKEYQNANLLQNNPYWYPENENHDLILPYNCPSSVANATYVSPASTSGDSYDGVTLTNESPTNDKTSMPWLNVTYYRQRKGNYFNTGSPFPDLLRGDIPTLDVLSANLDFTNVIGSDGKLIKSLLSIDEDGKLAQAFIPSGIEDPDAPTDLGSFVSGSGSNRRPYLAAFSRAATGSDLVNSSNNGLKELLNTGTVSGINFSLAEWRRLATMTVFRERMARTDGSYNQMIQAQFQYNPHWHEHSVRYCGGSSQPMVFSEVVQSSEDGNSPLGTTAGRGFSSSQGNMIHVKSDDFGMFMTVMTITPDDYYSQGISRMWSELTQSEQYFPILNNLNPQAIKNKELFVSGTDSDDEDVFNYQELFSHFKSRQNEVSGLMALPISKVGDTGAYILNRLFSSSPAFNNSFVTGKLTDNENLVFASTEQAQFIMSIVSEMKYVSPMPAVTQPSDMGISY